MGANVFGYVNAGYHNTQFTETAAIENWLLNTQPGIITSDIASGVTSNFPANFVPNVQTTPAFLAPGTGSVLRTVNSKLTDLVSSKDFGLIGDGVTDNTTAFANLTAYLVAHDGSILSFAPGTYVYTSPRWLEGIKNITVFGNGAKFKNTTAGVGATSTALFLDGGIVGNFSFVAAPEYPIATQAPNQFQVVTVTPSNASNFQVGDWVLYGGYSQIDAATGGLPQSLRYFEYNKVTAVNASTGTISLRVPTRNPYNANWNNQVNVSFPGFYFGTPFVIDLNRPTGATAFNIAEDVVLNDMIFLANPNNPSDVGGYGTVYIESGLNVKINDMTSGYTAIGLDQSVSIDNSYIVELEFDKEVDIVDINHSYLGNAFQATAINNLSIRNSTIQIGNPALGSPLNLGARNIILDHNNIFSNGQASSGAIVGISAGGINQVAVENASVTNNVFNQLPGLNLPLIGAGWTFNFTVVTGSSTQITAAFVPATMGGLDAGSIVTGPGGKTGTVTDIFNNGTNITILGVFPQTPSPGDVYTFNTIRNLTVYGNGAFNRSNQQSIIFPTFTGVDFLNQGSGYGFGQTTFSNLHACNSSAPILTGSTAYVTDSTTPFPGTTITGGGTYPVQAVCVGTAWVVSYGTFPSGNFASLPTPASAIFQQVRLTDSQVIVSGQIISTGGGSNAVLAFSDGVNWRVLGGANPGSTGTFTCGAGLHVATLVVQGGLITSTPTCN
jgi:hypothetical protein